MSNKILTRSLLLVFVVFAAYAEAHHSTVVFDRNKVIEVRGTIREFRLRNPHSFFVLEGRAYVDGVAQGNRRAEGIAEIAHGGEAG